MKFNHLLAFVPWTLVGMWVVTSDDRQSESPEEWAVRLSGTSSKCSGLLEIYLKGKWKSICSTGWTQQNADLACKQLGCGFPFGLLQPFAEEPQKQEALVLGCQGNETALEDCAQQESNCTSHLALVCQDPMETSTASQPTTAPFVTSLKPTDTPRIRLEDGTSLCSGTTELKFGGRWEMVCLALQSWWSGLAPRDCQGAKCDASIGLKDLAWRNPLPAHWSTVQCEQRNLSLGCLDKTQGCLITLVKCSAYKKLVKKYSKNREHQWIGPNGMNQNVSFHRSSSVTFQPRPESQEVQEENKYPALKKNFHLSPYAALEGASNRSSNPPDNSSDSDYDLCSAQRL
ncbi:T-cell surface glycoprotein CD5 [Podarcis lilfordi]|uniref:T-cell surface glycoprotein CD5 n=1 Tax=Podarcis lilfordi TaxID=74358 RepID=A0AA35NT65_9SAUR|nr:T-cell surface glycoprotein CD5 [Podarcis lilfordi]